MNSVLFKVIRENIGRFLLQSEVKKAVRNRKAFSLEQAQSVGIIFDSSSKEDFELLKKYISYLKEMKKKVKTIGYYSSGIVPESTYSKLEYDYFTTKQLNWAAQPRVSFVKNFIFEEYDILIDLNMNDNFPLQYIGGNSKAKFKVGKHTPFNEKYYDFLINIEQDKSLKYFLRQVDTYLFMINKPA